MFNRPFFLTARVVAAEALMMAASNWPQCIEVWYETTEGHEFRCR